MKMYQIYFSNSRSARVTIASGRTFLVSPVAHSENQPLMVVPEEMKESVSHIQPESKSGNSSSSSFHQQLEESVSKLDDSCREDAIRQRYLPLRAVPLL